MKRCLKGSPEPNCLTTFRNTPPLGDWDEFRDTQCYQTVRATTRADQGGLCAYCERLLGENDRQIAHFHPKSDATGTVNWALHWPNLWCACTGGDQAALANHPDAYLPPPVENRSCDVAKEDRVVDGSVLSPAEVPAYPRLFKYKQWVDGLHIGADNTNCAVANISPDLAKATIDTFNLNCRRLAQATLAVHRAIEGQIKRLREHAPQPEALFPSLVQWHLARSQDGCWKPFFTQMRWRFKEAAETYLQSIDYQG